MDREALVEYIRQAAIARGIDPDIAVRVAAAEGLYADPAEGWQSQVVNESGQREQSFGPFQLFLGGGLGNEFMEETGLDPRDPETVTQQIDFALDQALEQGWSPWYGAANSGIGDREGLPGGEGTMAANANDPAVIELVEQGVDLPLALAAVESSRARPSGTDQASVEEEAAPGTSPMGLLSLAGKLAAGPSYPSSLPTTTIRGSGGSGTRALSRLGVKPLA